MRLSIAGHYSQRHMLVEGTIHVAVGGGTRHVTCIDAAGRSPSSRLTVAEYTMKMVVEECNMLLEQYD
jgi:hypothetical protein